MKVKLIAVTKYLRGSGAPEELLEHAGRACYRSEKRGGAGNFLQARIREGHESIIEHASLTFEISGISRVCSHQLVRHRIASYSQRSQRYVREAEPEYVIPPSISADEEALSAFEEAMTSAWAAYSDLLKLGIRPQDARFVLPNACKTRIMVTMNFRSWRHFIKERGVNPAAQWEIRDIALQILTILSQEAPSCFSDLIPSSIACSRMNSILVFC